MCLDLDFSGGYISRTEVGDHPSRIIPARNMVLTVQKAQIFNVSHPIPDNKASTLMCHSWIKTTVSKNLEKASE